MKKLKKISDHILRFYRKAKKKIVRKIMIEMCIRDSYNIANIARLLTELPDEDLKEVMFMIEYKRKRNEEKNRSEKF